MKILEIFAKKDDLCSLSGTTNCDSNWDFKGFMSSGIAKNVVSNLFIVAGIVSVIAIIICGIMMMTSAGDAAKVAKAKKGLFGAVIGLVISVCAFAIAKAVVKALG
jgi:hypothetical protein